MTKSDELAAGATASRSSSRTSPAAAATCELLRAPADGHTILLASVGVLAVNPFAMKDVGYTPQDFAAITLAVDFSNVIVVHPSVPAQSIAEYLALAKGPDGMTYGTFAQQGMETLPGTPQEAAAHVEQERAVWKKVIADAGLRLE